MDIPGYTGDIINQLIFCHYLGADFWWFSSKIWIVHHQKWEYFVNEQWIWRWLKPGLIGFTRRCVGWNPNDNGGVTTVNISWFSQDMYGFYTPDITHQFDIRIACRKIRLNKICGWSLFSPIPFKVVKDGWRSTEPYFFIFFQKLSQAIVDVKFTTPSRAGVWIQQLTALRDMQRVSSDTAVSRNSMHFNVV